jgi:hypothetical protein
MPPGMRPGEDAQGDAARRASVDERTAALRDINAVKAIRRPFGWLRQRPAGYGFCAKQAPSLSGRHVSS